MKRKGHFVVLASFAMLGLVMFSCGKKNPYEVDLKGVKTEPVKIFRYEEVLFDGNPYEIQQRVEASKEDFALFLDTDFEDPQLLQQLFDYVTDPNLKEIYLDVKEAFPNLQWLEKELEMAFRYYRYYYPEKEQPIVYSYVSGLDFEYPVKIADNHVIIGLDLYLGANYPRYPRVGIPAYLTQKMSKEYVVVDVMRALADEQMRGVPAPRNFLDNMVYAGKTLFFLDLMLPHVHDSIKMNYSLSQLRWCERNQGHVWAYFISNEMLYSTDRLMINKFLGAAPFTSPFSADSPPRVANWIGWQIVRKYMERNKNVSVQELLEEADAQKILARSAYKPPK